MDDSSSQGEQHPATAADASGYTLQINWTGCHSGGQRPAQVNVHPEELLSEVIDRVCDKISMKWFMFAWILHTHSRLLNLGSGTHEQCCEVLSSTLSELGADSNAKLLISGKMRSVPPDNFVTGQSMLDYFRFCVERMGHASPNS